MGYPSKWEQLNTHSLCPRLLNVCERGKKRRGARAGEWEGRRKERIRVSPNLMSRMSQRGRWRERHRKDARGAIILFVSYLILFRWIWLGIGTKVLIGHPSTWEQLNTHSLCPRLLSVCERGKKRTGARAGEWEGKGKENQGLA